MKLWLDDIRPAPEGWTRARSVNTAIALMGFYRDNLIDVSLDHDMGDFSDQGGDGVKLVLWMIENNVWPANRPTIHSMNPVGRKNMEALIERYGNYGDCI